MPVGGALFGSAATGPGSTGGNKHLVEMRAGKMNMKGRTVLPDKRKGLLYVYQSEDSLMHFCWQDRTTGVVEDDLIIFPDDCEYVKVPQCTTGRVYLLKFKSSARKFFFWLQEPRPDKDEDNCKRINELLNNPSSAVQSSQSPDQDLQSLLNNMSQSQLMQLFGGGVGQIGGLSSLLGTIRGPSSGSARTTSTPAITHRTTVPSTPTTNTAASAATVTTTPVAAATTTPAAPQNSSTSITATTTTDSSRTATNTTPASTTTRTSDSKTFPIQLADLQSFMQGINPTTTGATPASSQQQQQQSVDLSTALTNDTLSGILNNPGALQLLQNHLPAVEGNIEDALRSTLASPQFQQAVSQFSSALESGQLGPVVSQLAVNPEAVAAASQGNMQDFVKALEKSSGGGSKDDKNKDKSSSNNDKTKKNNDDDDEQMQLD